MVDNTNKAAAVFVDGVKKSLRSKDCAHPRVDTITMKPAQAVPCPDCGTWIDAAGRNRTYEALEIINARSDHHRHSRR